MRVAPVGAYFAMTWGWLWSTRRSRQLRRTAIRKALPARLRLPSRRRLHGATVKRTSAMRPAAFLEAVRAHTPEGKVREGIDRALELPASTTALDAALTIGNGARATAQDTVPFALWSAARSLDSYEDALWETVTAAAIIDTNCAIVGGIVAMRAGVGSIPREWLATARAVSATAPGGDEERLSNPSLSDPDRLGLQRYAEELAHARLDGVAQRGDVRRGGAALIGKSERMTRGDRGCALAIALDEAGTLQQPCRGQLYLLLRRQDSAAPRLPECRRRLRSAATRDAATTGFLKKLPALRRSGLSGVITIPLPSRISRTASRTCCRQGSAMFLILKVML